MNNKEKYVFGDGKYCIFEREMARGAVCFYGGFLSLFEPEDEPGGDCRESRRGESISFTSESEAIGGEDGERRLSAKKVLEIKKVLNRDK